MAKNVSILVILPFAVNHPYVVNCDEIHIQTTISIYKFDGRDVEQEIRPPQSMQP